MKNYLILFLSVILVNTIDAQFITTNPSTTPITLSAPVNVTEDLNLSSGKSLKLGGAKFLAGGASDVFLGLNTGVSATGGLNTFIGTFAGEKTTTGSSNFFLGYGAGAENINGYSNVYLGVGAGRFSTSAHSNIFIGGNSGRLNQTGVENLVIGTGAGFNNISGGSNVILGFQAGASNTNSNNTFIGRSAGYPNTTGTNNTYIGYGAGTGATLATLNNATAIGYNAAVTTSNSLVLGNAANVGINTTAPAAKLHVVGDFTPGGGVKFEYLPTDVVGGTSTQFVVIDANGFLYKYGGSTPARQGVAENAYTSLPTSFTENWTLKNDFLYNKNKKGIIIGEGISSLPKGYGMYVTDGILTEKVKVAIKNSSDWADYVFAKDYKKLTLTQVEQFININKHLPNVPSAAEMAIEGNDLHKTDVKLLEKIEELTLYMIEMKKENIQMKRQINSLKRKLNK